MTLGHLRAAGRRKETPKKAVVAGGTALQVYVNGDREVAASWACDSVSFPGAVIKQLEEKGFGEGGPLHLTIPGHSPLLQGPRSQEHREDAG